MSSSSPSSSSSSSPQLHRRCRHRRCSLLVQSCHCHSMGRGRLSLHCDHCQGRSCEVAMENPAWSFIWKFAAMTAAFVATNMVHSATCHRCAFDTAKPGKRIGKIYKFKASGAWITETAASCRCKGKPHVKLTMALDGGHPDGVHWGRNLLSSSRRPFLPGRNGIRYTGVPAKLTKSAEYPAKLGARIVRAWAQSQRQIQSPRRPESRTSASQQLGNWLRPCMCSNEKSSSSSRGEKPMQKKRKILQQTSLRGETPHQKPFASWMKPQASGASSSGSSSGSSNWMSPSAY